MTSDRWAVGIQQTKCDSEFAKRNHPQVIQLSSDFNSQGGESLQQLTSQIDESLKEM